MADRHDIVLNFRRGLYYSRVFFLCRPPRPMDILGVLRRELPDGEWKLQYRFRYYMDEKAFGSADKKNFYSGVFEKGKSAEEVASLRTEAFGLIAMMEGLDLDVVVIDSDDPEVIRKHIAACPWASMRIDPSGVVQ